MPVSFGSVGDIIAICQLVQSLVKTLSDTAPEYQDLVSEIDALSNILRQIQRLSNNFETKADVSNINDEIRRCHSTLEIIQLKISKYKHSLSLKKGSGNPIRDGYWKLRWQNQKERVAIYKHQIAAHYRCIQSQMQILGMDAAASDSQKVFARFDQTHSMLIQIADAVGQRHKNVKTDQTAAIGGVGGVLLSGYVKPALQRVESIAASIPKGVLQAQPIMTSFEEAAATCKKRCAELSLRCSKDNTYYRDSEFEIDVDLIEGNRNCLDDLLCDAGEPSDLQPRAVRRVHDIFPHPTFLKERAVQDAGLSSSIESRWWQAGISTALNVPSFFDRLCICREERSGIYGFLFYRDGAWMPAIVDDNLYLRNGDWDELSNDDRVKFQGARDWRTEETQKKYREIFQTGSRSLYFSACMDEEETWLSLLEKAYAKAHGDYSALSWGNPGYNPRVRD
ncbi:MAG: hypothetical protein Q9170_007447 [Blastenia crenularia]